MDLSKFNKLNRKQSTFQIKDDNTGYEAKGMRQQVWGGGMGISFSMSTEFVSESDPMGMFPLFSKTFDDILSLSGNSGENTAKQKQLSRKERKALETKNALPAPVENKNENASGSIFQSVYDYWFK